MISPKLERLQCPPATGGIYDVSNGTLDSSGKEGMAVMGNSVDGRHGHLLPSSESNQGIRLT